MFHSYVSHYQRVPQPNVDTAITADPQDAMLTLPGVHQETAGLLRHWLLLGNYTGGTSIAWLFGSSKHLGNMSKPLKAIRHTGQIMFSIYV